MKPIERVLNYSRTSQEDTGTLEDQIKNLLKLITDNGWELAEDPYIEEVSSTDVKSRPKLQALLARVAEGDVDAIVCRDWDRFSRTENMRIDGDLKERFRETSTLFVDGSGRIIDFSTMEGRIVGGVESEMAAEENRRRVKRIKQTKDSALENGIYRQSGSVVFGYKVLSGNRITKTPCKVVQNAPEVEVLKEVCRLMVDEGYSATKVCVHLNDMGVKTRRGRDWRPATLTSIIRNTALYGEIIANRWVKEDAKMVERPEEEWKVTYIEDPVFAKSEWETLNQVLDNNRSNGRPAQLEGIFLARGLVKCDICGRKYTTFNGGAGKDHKKYYYACPCRRIPKDKLINGATPCKLSPIARQDELDKEVWDKVCQVLVWTEKAINEWFKSDPKTFTKEDEKELEGIKNTIEGYRAQIRKWMDMGDSGMELAYVKAKIDHYKGLIDIAQRKSEKVLEWKEMAEADRVKQENLIEGTKVIHSLLFEKFGVDAVKAPDKRTVLYWTLKELDFDSRRKLVEAICGTEFIHIGPAQPEIGEKMTWGLWFQGIFDTDRVIKGIESLDKTVYSKGINTTWYR